MKSNLFLAIDTSSENGSIAVGNGKVIVHRVSLSSDKKASQSLFPALTQIGLPRMTLGRIIVGIGPGSFSGIRVGLAAAYGIAQVQNCPVVGISSAFSIAIQRMTVPYLGVYADARRQELFCTEFRFGRLMEATYLIPADDFDRHSARFDVVVSPEPLKTIQEVVYPRAEDLLMLPEDFPFWVTGDSIEPIYLRDARPVLPKLNRTRDASAAEPPVSTENPIESQDVPVA
jgi:tRNA threonylcarbamoyl adenosine modification protein YeaZ